MFNGCILVLEYQNVFVPLCSYTISVHLSSGFKTNEALRHVKTEAVSATRVCCTVKTSTVDVIVVSIALVGRFGVT